MCTAQTLKNYQPNNKTQRKNMLMEHICLKTKIFS